MWKSPTETFEKGLGVGAGRAGERPFLMVLRCEEPLISEGCVLGSSDTCMLTGCLLENICYQSSGVEAIRACSEALRTSPERTSAPFFFLLLQRARWERCRGFRLLTMGMSGSALQGSHREGILLPVTMNRKPSPPPEPTQTFDVKGGSHSRCGSTAHSCLGCLATSPHHARAAVRSAQTEQGGTTSEGKGNKLKPLRLTWFSVRLQRTHSLY